jgi:hypothetical protein
MSASTDASLMATTAGQLGAGIAEFIISMLCSYVLLRFAGSPKRSGDTAIVLRSFAIAIALLLAYVAYVGGGHLSAGAICAVVVTVAWAAKQQFMAKGATGRPGEE